jgi:predicted nuclease with TOPRIM domain
MTFAEYAPEVNDPISDFVGGIEQFKDTYLVPIFGGVSISSIIGTIVSMVITFVYRKIVKDLKERMEKLSSEDQQKIDNVHNEIKYTLTKLGEYIELVKEEKTITAEARKELVAEVNKIADKIAELSNKTEQLAKLRTITTQLIKVIGAFVQTNKELVASGVGEEIEKLIEQAKSL